MSKYSEVTEKMAIYHCANEDFDKYWPIIENILNEERDSELKEYIFGADKVEYTKIMEIIDRWELCKETWDETIFGSYIEAYGDL